MLSPHRYWSGGVAGSAPPRDVGIVGGDGGRQGMCIHAIFPQNLHKQ
jgi:hypothetical protein